MTAYSQSSAVNPISSIAPGDSGYAFGTRSPYAGVADVGEAVTTGEKSQAFAIRSGSMPFAGSPQQLSVELQFSAAPGAFTISLQTADTDVDAAYVTETSGTITTVSAPSTTTARLEVTTLKARFARLLVTSQPANGGITVIAKISR